MYFTTVWIQFGLAATLIVWEAAQELTNDPATNQDKNLRSVQEKRQSATSWGERVNTLPHTTHSLRDEN